MPARLQEDIGKNVQTLRKRLELTQVQLAERVGIEDATVRAIETGRRGVSIETLEALADALRVKPAELLASADRVTVDPLAREGAVILEALGGPWSRFALRWLRDLQKTVNSAPGPAHRRKKSG